MYKNQKVSKNHQKLQFPKKLVVFIFLGLLVLGFGLYEVRASMHRDAVNTQDQVTAKKAAQDNNVNYNPPTTEEKQAGDNAKDKVVATNNPQTAMTANVIIADANQYDDGIEVRAYVSNLIQDGQCNFTFSMGATTFKESTVATKDATTTQCKSLTLPRDRFTSAGSWTVVVTYSNDTITGQATSKFQVK